jgi:hypothetical protein
MFFSRFYTFFCQYENPSSCNSGRFFESSPALWYCVDGVWGVVQLRHLFGLASLYEFVLAGLIIDGSYFFSFADHQSRELHPCKELLSVFVFLKNC